MQIEWSLIYTCTKFIYITRICSMASFASFILYICGMVIHSTCTGRSMILHVYNIYILDMDRKYGQKIFFDLS